MEHRAKAFFLLLVTVSLVSVSAAQSGVSDYRDSLEAQCSVASDDAYIDVRDSPYNITLFGEKVEQVECGNLDAYKFSGTGNNNTTSSAGLSATDFAVGLIPLLLAAGISGYLSYGYQLDLDEGLVLVASSLTSFVIGGVVALLLGKISFIPWPLQALFVLAGVLAPGTLIFLNENIEEDDVKLRLLITGLTSTGALISTLVLLILSSGSL